MELNTKKCKSMHVSRRATSSATYKVNNIPLRTVASYKCLGLHITNTLAWITDVDYVINKANGMPRYVRRNFNAVPPSLRLFLY